MPVAFVLAKGQEQEDDIAQNHHQVIQASEDAVEDEDLPKPVILFEIKVECLVVRAIAEMMSEMSLANEMKGRGEKQGHKAPDPVIPTAMGKEHAMFRLVDDGIDGIHDDPEEHRDGRDHPKTSDPGNDNDTRANGQQLATHDDGIKPVGNGSGRFASESAHLRVWLPMTIPESGRGSIERFDNGLRFFNYAARRMPATVSP